MPTFGGGCAIELWGWLSRPIPATYIISRLMIPHWWLNLPQESSCYLVNLHFLFIIVFLMRMFLSWSGSCFSQLFLSYKAYVSLFLYCIVGKSKWHNHTHRVAQPKNPCMGLNVPIRKFHTFAVNCKMSSLLLEIWYKKNIF